MQIQHLFPVPISGCPIKRQYIQDTYTFVPSPELVHTCRKWSSQSTCIIFHLCCNVFLLPVLFYVKDNTVLLEKSISSMMTWNWQRKWEQIKEALSTF